MRELQIAANMIALARSRKGGSKRSAMLRMIMPFLSRETGDKLAEAINKQDSKRFAQEWDKVKKEITARLSIHHKKKGHHATAADVSAFPRDDGTSVCVRTYGAPEKIRININGNNIFEGAAPEENCGPVEQPVSESNCTPVGQIDGQRATIQIDQGQTGANYFVTDPQIVEMIKLVCERLLLGADPCPLPAIEKPETKTFDYNADILELYDRLVTCKSL